MWSLALASLAVLTVAVDCTCPLGHEPLNKTMRRLTMSGPMTWREVDEACINEFGKGFQMLDRDFLFLSLEDKALCRGNSAPLRLSKEGLKPIVWPKSNFFPTEEEVNSTYLTHMRADKVPPLSAGWQVGSLGLSTGQWRLVDNRTKFSCAICQRAWVDVEYGYFVSPPSRPGPLDNVFTFHLSETGNNRVGLDEALHLAEKRLNATVKKEGDLLQIKIGKVAAHADSGNGSSLRLKSSHAVSPEEVLEVLKGSYTVKSWQDMSWCPDTSFLGLAWEETESGEVGEVRLQDSHVATRWCSWRLYPNGDWDAVWEDQVLLWIDREWECQEYGLSNLVGRLQDYYERDDLGSPDLKSLVEITAGSNKMELPSFGWEPYLTNASSTIASILSSLLVARATNVNTSSECNGKACVLFSADVLGAGGPDILLIFEENAQPKFLNMNNSSAANQITYMALQLPQALTSAARVAMHAWQDLGITDKISMVVQVVASRLFNESEPERSRPFVNFHVYNKENIFPYQYRSLFSLGESEESTLPCPLVRSVGSVDTYSCNKWKRGSHNFTAGNFLTYTWWLRYRPIDYEHVVKPVLLGYTTIPLDEAALLKVANFTNLLLDRQLQSNVDIFHPWQEILSGVVLTEPVIKVSLEHVKVLVSDLTVDDPVVGFSLPRLDGADAVETFTASSRNVSAKSAVDLVLGGDLPEHCKQLAILAVSGVVDFDFEGSLQAYIKRKLMVIHLVATLRRATENSPENVYFEIQLNSGRRSEEKVEASNVHEVDTGKSDVVEETHNKSQSNDAMVRFHVATWSEVDGDWFVSSCVKLRSTRASKLVVRCESLTFADGALRGRFLVFEPVDFAEALGTTLLVVLISAGVLSGVSLASIACTAAFLPAWRKDLGHKIVLQMTLALSLNLTLGFTSSFVSVDTASVSCVAVGALRHFSFLAMFAWMLVMSGLQLRRLLSVLGARSTSNLLLKVSFFAWGLPTIAVGSLLIFKLDMYQSDEADRGYCYPEGTAFTWSVQAPAATVLALNAFIFVVILARLYGFLGWGKTADLRRHLNERAFQMRRVRAVFFTFFIFGLTWLFHLLAEQGVFQAKFLYEYLFLMTASVHVFSLSCIFVFFDPEARAEFEKIVLSLRISELVSFR